jgi:hypothetical protein
VTKKVRAGLSIGINVLAYATDREPVRRIADPSTKTH